MAGLETRTELESAQNEQRYLRERLTNWSARWSTERIRVTAECERLETEVWALKAQVLVEQSKEIDERVRQDRTGTLRLPWWQSGYCGPAMFLGALSTFIAVRELPYPTLPTQLGLVLLSVPLVVNVARIIRTWKY